MPEALERAGLFDTDRRGGLPGLALQAAEVRDTTATTTGTSNLPGQQDMNAERFATWIRRQDRHVYRTVSSYWYDAGPRVLQAFPYHWLITPSRSELDALMWKHGIIALRYSTPLGSQRGAVSYHVVLRRPYELEMLKSQARNGVKSGLAHFHIEQISFERLATEGWALQQDTLVRQDRVRSMSQQEWERLCRAAIDVPGFEAWAATSEGELAGAVIICRIDDLFNVPYAMSHSRFLGNHVNNVLFFAVSREMLSRPGVRGIFFTVQSLDAPPNVDEFKFRMGLAPKAICQRVEFHPLLRPFVTPALHAQILKRLQKDPSHPMWTKAEGMVRLYLQGKRPLSEQDWPACIAGQKEAYLREASKAPMVGPHSGQKGEVAAMNLDGCQLPSVPGFAVGAAPIHGSAIQHLKALLAKPWNSTVKRRLKQAYATSLEWRGPSSAPLAAQDSLGNLPLSNGDLVRVRSREEILATLNPFQELKGCAFLPQMYQYCGTEQRVLRSMQRFMDERDYKMKKVRGVVLLENLICNGTAAFGACDRCCFLFWREEWLERLPVEKSPVEGV